MHLHNFAPAHYRFRPECKLHGSWSACDPINEEVELIEWASADIWLEEAVVSFKMRSPRISIASQGEVEVKPLNRCASENCGTQVDRHSKATAVTNKLEAVLMSAHPAPSCFEGLSFTLTM